MIKQVTQQAVTRPQCTTLARAQQFIVVSEQGFYKKVLSLFPGAIGLLVGQNIIVDSRLAWQLKAPGVKFLVIGNLLDNRNLALTTRLSPAFLCLPYPFLPAPFPVAGSCFSCPLCISSLFLQTSSFCSECSCFLHFAFLSWRPDQIRAPLTL